MFRVSSLVVVLICLGLMIYIPRSHNATAQQFSESDLAYEAARNKIGLMRYCRNKRMLDPIMAGRAIAALETGLGAPPPVDSALWKQGDRAQQAGEDGLWSSGGNRDLATAAKLLFRTTPEDLCQGWAEETLKGPQEEGRRETTIAVSAPTQPIEPYPQAKPTIIEPAPVDRPPALDRPAALDKQPVLNKPSASDKAPALDKTPADADAAMKAVRAAPPAPPLPPLPERAPPPPAKGEFASLQRSAPAGANLASTGKAVPGQISGTAAASPGIAPLSGQAAPLSATPAAEAAGQPPSEQTTSAATSVWGKWPFNRLGKPGRCLMANCSWSPPQEKSSPAN